MKVFRLACEQGHDFEGWFASSEVFDRQSAAGDVACPSCDSRFVAKMPSAPYVNTGVRGTETVAAPAMPPARDLAVAMAALKTYVLANTEDVGRRFPEVARRIHYGEESLRGIRGRVTPREADDLREEGVDALALPAGIVLADEVH